MPIAFSTRNSPAEGGGEKLTTGSVLLLLSLILFLGIGIFASLPGPAGGDEPVAIVFPFWMARAEAVARSFEAGERVLRTGRLGSIVVTAPGRSSGSLPRGAWFSLRLIGLAGCLDSEAIAEERR